MIDECPPGGAATKVDIRGDGPRGEAPLTPVRRGEFARMAGDLGVLWLIFLALEGGASMVTP